VSTSLFVLADQYRHLQLLAEAETDVPAEVITDTLEALKGDLQDKAVNVAKFLRNLEVFADDIDQAAKEMKDRAARVRKRAEQIRGYLLSNMQACEISRIESPFFTIAIKKNPAAVVVFDEKQIPAAFMRQKPPPAPEPDKTAIKAALQAGGDVPGCRLEQGVRLEVKA
jgi:phage repressor protein C with HTH and peptisase S24 domain